MSHVTTPTGENLFIARALKATDGTADLAIVAARFLDVLHARPGLEAARLEPTQSGTEFVLRLAADPRANIVLAEPQILLGRLSVSLYGKGSEHAAWHGLSCGLVWIKDWSGSYARTHITDPGQLDDLASHIDRAWALKQARVAA